jgi:hypothetical protein
MNARDFELIAATLKASRPAAHLQMVELALVDMWLDRLTRQFADTLRATNKQFNRGKFIRACGGQP